MSAQPQASEDCLYLNVFVPRTLGTSAGSTPRAVMVWIYGGANAQGASDYYDPTPLVEAEDVIVVTVNYRIGTLGFLAHPAIDAEGHTAVTTASGPAAGVEVGAGHRRVQRRQGMSPSSVNRQAV
jgi:carboxylesterase type B